MPIFRDLRYVRVAAEDLPAISRFAIEIFGLQLGESDEDNLRLRSDARNYSLCFARGSRPAIGLMVGSAEELEALEARLGHAGYPARTLTPAEANLRQVKAGFIVTAPNDVDVEVVIRHLTSGWRFYGARDAGITGLESVSLRVRDVAANERFWVEGLGLRVADWVGDAVLLAFDECHHRVAIYPSGSDAILGATWSVQSKDNVMANWYFLQKVQAPVMAGPDRQPTSGAMFVTTRAPNGLLMSYAAETEYGPQLEARGPRQFADAPQSHCAWGSQTEVPEFQGRGDR